MANEFKHSTVGSQLSQTEYESTTGHVLDSQAAGDIIYASSTSQLSRLGIGTAGKVLAVNSGASAPEYVAALTGVTSVLNTALVVGRDADNDIDFGTDNTILFRADGADQIKLTNGALLPVTDDDIDLGSSSLQFKDGFFDGTLEADAITVGGTAVLTGGAETAITSILNTSLVLGRDADNDIDFGTDNNIIFRAGAADQIKLIDGALAPVTDNDVDLGTSSLEFKDAYFDGTVNTDALAMATNTSGNLLVANGSSFASTAVGDLSEISTVANDDVFLAVDTSGGGLKKIARSAIVAGLATSGAISNVVEDTSPELGGDLDVLTHGIVTGASNRNIALTPHGTGVVRIDGSNGVDIESGAISIKNGGAESYVRFYCESSNAHYTQLQASPHSAYSGNVTVVLPAAATNLVGDDTTQTLTNKRLTSPKINEDVALTSTATELNLLDGVSGLVQADFTKLAAIDATDTEINTVADGNTSVGTTAVADGDGIVTNDGGTMKQTSVETFATYFGSEITAMSNLVTTGTLNSGAISSGFGNIDIGSSTFDTTGAVSTGALNPAGDVTIADGKGIIIDSTPTNDGFNGIFASFDNATGATINQGEVVYITGTANQVAKARANADNTMPAVAIATADVANGASGNFMLHGIVHDSSKFPTLAIGGEVYVSEDTAGLITSTLPASSGDRVQVIGIGLHGDKMLFNPSYDIVERG
tara:strand:- start:135 stop:2252 length:2118 start_codon:yes stop_codon:yes gene_type:complete